MKFTFNDYYQSLKLLNEKTNNSIIDFQITAYDDDKNIEISYPYKNDTLGQYYELELQKICFETGFYKYVTNEGSDFGPISTDKQIIPRRSYFYMLNDDFEVWADFETEFTNLQNKLKTIVENADKLSI